jgi:hypothetical protein
MNENALFVLAVLSDEPNLEAMHRFRPKIGIRHLSPKQFYRIQSRLGPWIYREAQVLRQAAF